MPVPPQIHDQHYISLTTFRANGVGVPTPVWFGESSGKLYVMTRSISGKYKRIQANSEVKIASCTIRGKVTGPDFTATAQMLPQGQWPKAKKTITDKYWLARVPFLWRKTDAYLELEVKP